MYLKCKKDSKCSLKISLNTLLYELRKSQNQEHAVTGKSYQNYLKIYLKN